MVFINSSKGIKQMKDVLKLFRVKHYIKNLLVFVPLFFAGEIFNISLMKHAIGGFVCFCLIRMNSCRYRIKISRSFVERTARNAFYSSITEISMLISSLGLSPRMVSQFWIFSTTSRPSSTSPNTVYWLSRNGVPPTSV